MTTTKFSEGDRVRAYSSSGSIDGTVERIWTDNTVAVKPDNSSSVISYHYVRRKGFPRVEGN